MKALIEKPLAWLTWWFVPTIGGIAVPLLITFTWWLRGGEPSGRILHAGGLGLDVIGFLLIGYTIAFGRREYESKQAPPYGKMTWFRKLEYIDSYSKFDVALAKLGVGLVLAGFGYQIWGALLN